MPTSLSAPPLRPEQVVRQVHSAHARERQLIDGLTDEALRAPSPLPGWTRAHLLAARLVFLRAALRQVDAAREGRTTAFYADGPDPRQADRDGRDRMVAEHLGRPAAELVRDVQDATVEADRVLAAVGPEDWERPARYRGRGTLLDVLFACWRESEVHITDYELGPRPADWSPEFCGHLLDYLERRVPAGMRFELSTPDGGTRVLGRGEPVEVSGELADLAAWLGGRRPDGPLRSSTGALPDLGRGAAQLTG